LGGEEEDEVLHQRRLDRDDRLAVGVAQVESLDDGAEGPGQPVESQWRGHSPAAVGIETSVDVM
jgi:hypothetical protein